MPSLPALPTFPARTPARLAAVALAFAAAVTGAVVTGTVADATDKRPPRGAAVQQAELVARAVLPAQTFGEAIPSGSAITAANGITPPFAAQPVQGFSSVLPQRDGTLLALSDNGYGAKANSADFLLRVTRLRADLSGSPAGKVQVLGGFGLSDPDNKVPFPLTRPDRRLTGADFDLESFRQLPDGTFWFGEEFGPFLLHTDARGRLLDAPVPLPAVASPDDPLRRPATLGGSKGFEGLALTTDAKRLLALLEGPVTGDNPQDLRINTFDLRSQTFDKRFLRYRLEHPTSAIGEITAVDADRYLVLERDNGQGATARFKAVYLIDTRDRDKDGYVDKTLLVNLLAVPDPRALGGDGPFFRFPFTTIESVALLDDETILVANDNNFPFSSGRTPGAADDNEIIAIRLGTPLDADRRALQPR